MSDDLKRLVAFSLTLFSVLAFWADIAQAQQKTTPEIFIRFKVVEPAGQLFGVTIGGFRHVGEDWQFPPITTEVSGATWSGWIDLRQYNWHGRMDRSGGVAEYPSLKLSVARLDLSEPIRGCTFEVQLADKPDEKSVVISFTERSQSNTIAFLAPNPLRENAKEFETGSQMAARHAKWAQEATGGEPITLKKFDIVSLIWSHYDPALELQEAQTLQSLGFNVLGDMSTVNARKIGMRIYGHTWLYHPDPDAVATEWKKYSEGQLAAERATEDGNWKYSTMPHWVISDEVSALDFRQVDKIKLNNWFRAYLKSKGVTDTELGRPIDQIEYPAEAMFEKTMPQNAPLATRRLTYYAAKFGQWWSAKQMRQTTDLVRTSLPGMKTETLLPSHGFLGNAWDVFNIGMSYRMHDIFELGEQESVNQLSAEDWLGLNHMYGPEYTWTGGQTFGYFSALMRSAIADRPMMLRGLITPSDDEYLQLKAYSGLGQGAKSFYFWAYGPTFIGTENYWSDLRSEYDGIAKLNRALEKSEDVLYPAKPVTDPVAILYSVSNDIWNTNYHAAFVEKRLMWHALKHLQIQPNFLREEDITAGKLKNYKVLYIADWCISRKASAAIDEWVKQGGVVYLSAGAATRDEFYESYTPPFASAIWGNDATAAQRLVNEKHNYNERTDLPQIKPLTDAKIQINGRSFTLPVIGVRLDLRGNGKSFASFGDGANAGQTISYGSGQIIGVGFMPMLAYGSLANFKPKTLEEKWTPEPREIIKMALDAAKVEPSVEADAPVVEVNLLTGANGSALVLANYTYQPIDSLTIDVKLPETVKQAVSTQGSQVQLIEQPSGRVRLKLPLKSVDIILLK